MRPLSWRSRSGRDGEAGSISVEWSGLALVTAAIVGIVTLGMTSAQIGQQVSAVTCRVLTAGQGACGLPADSGADAGQLLEPCAAADRGYSTTNQFVVDNRGRAGERDYLIQSLSNGQLQLSVADRPLDGNSLATGIADRSQGFLGQAWGAIGAGAPNTGGAPESESLRVQSAETYVVNDAQQLSRVVRDRGIAEAAHTAMASDNPLLDGGLSVITDGLAGWFGSRLGLPAEPTPTATTYFAGASAEASSWLSPVSGVALASTEGMTRLSGVTVQADGATTIHAQVAGHPGVREDSAPQEGSRGEPLSSLVSLALGKDGTVQQAQVRSLSLAGDSRQTLTMRLPVSSESDRQSAAELLSPTVQSSVWSDFANQVEARGEATRVVHSPREVAAVEDDLGAVGMLANAGVSADSTQAGETVTSAEYFDGQGWGAWDACGAG